MLNFWEWPQRDLNDTDGTIVTVSAPTSPEPLHRRPRTDQRLLSAAPEAPPLTEMVFGSFERVLPLHERAGSDKRRAWAALMRGKQTRGMTVNLRSVQEGGALAGPNV